MARALLINPSYSSTYGSNEGGIAFPVYPILSLAAIGGVLRERGHEFRILDLSYRPYDPDVIRQEIREFRPDLVGVTATTPLANQMRDISYIAKEISPDIVAIAGGAHPSAMPYETMAQCVHDAVAMGEADYTVADILDGVPFAQVPGLYWRDGEEIRVNPPAALIHDLDQLPIPAWDAYPPESNRRMTRIIARHSPVTTIEFSRGCVFRCDFCGSKNTMGLGYRKKSPERCAEEVAIAARLGYRELVLVDDIFTSDNEWAAAVCEEIIRKDTKIAWTCTNGIRVDSANTELFELMKRAGCYRVYFGFESGNDEVLRAFGKGGKATLAKGIQAVELARNAGLEPNGFFMVGLTGDTEASMQDTIDYAKRVRLDTMKCGMTVPFPGTPMFRQLQAQGRIKTFDWDQYTVYNSAENIFDHPSLPWSVIKRYFRKFYREAYLMNPTYMWRRLVFMIRNHEIRSNIFYTLKFLFLILASRPQPQKENYAHEKRWRELDDAPVAYRRDYELPQARGVVSRRQKHAAAVPAE
ncbi:MAG: radical SAM protein [Alphaproteobacteria bacterium]|nr:radical SAM protein [Alphaproteobacteria bacterium]